MLKWQTIQLHSTMLRKCTVHVHAYAYVYAFVCFMSQSPLTTIDEAITLF